MDKEAVLKRAAEWMLNMQENFEWGTTRALDALKKVGVDVKRLDQQERDRLLERLWDEFEAEREKRSKRDS